MARGVYYPDDEPEEVTQWRSQRIIAIAAVRELRKKLDIISVGANWGKAFGIGAILCGGIASIVGGIMVFRKSPSAVTAMNYGSLLYNSGAFVEALSKFVYSFAPVYFLNEVEAILDKDKELSQTLQQCLEYSPRCDTKELLKELFCNDLESSALKLESEISIVINSSRGIIATLDSLNKRQYPMTIGTDVKIQRLRELLNNNNNKNTDVANILAKSLTNVAVKEGVHVYKSLFSNKASTTDSHSKNEQPKDSARVNANAVEPDGKKKTGSSNNLDGALKSAVSANVDEKNAIQDDGKLTSDTAEIPSESATSIFLTFQAIETVSSIFPFVSAVMVIKNRKSMYSDAIHDIISPLERELRNVDLFRRRVWRRREMIPD